MCYMFVLIAYTSRYRPEEERPERQRYSWRNSTSSQNGGADSNKGNTAAAEAG